MCCIDAEVNKSVQINGNSSRSKVKELLTKYTRSPWWIHDARLADFCEIKNDGDLHNTRILGKYMPRGTNFWESQRGLNAKALKNNYGGLTELY